MGVYDAPQWLLSAFVRSVQAIGGTAQPEEIRSTAEALIERWTAPDRRFHNLKHLVDVLARVDQLNEETHEPDIAAHAGRRITFKDGLIIDDSIDNSFAGPETPAQGG